MKRKETIITHENVQELLGVNMTLLTKHTKDKYIHKTRSNVTGATMNYLLIPDVINTFNDKLFNVTYRTSNGVKRRWIDIICACCDLHTSTEFIHINRHNAMKLVGVSWDNITTKVPARVLKSSRSTNDETPFLFPIDIYRAISAQIDRRKTLTDSRALKMLDQRNRMVDLMGYTPIEDVVKDVVVYYDTSAYGIEMTGSYGKAILDAFEKPSEVIINLANDLLCSGIDNVEELGILFLTEVLSMPSATVSSTVGVIHEEFREELKILSKKG